MNKGEDGARKFYYYFRDEKLRPLITVCLLENDGKFHRGIAICSPRDFPRKAEGRNIALGRARQAQKKGKTDINSVSTRDETIFVFRESSFLYSSRIRSPLSVMGITFILAFFSEAINCQGTILE